MRRLLPTPLHGEVLVWAAVLYVACIAVFAPNPVNYTILIVTCVAQLAIRVWALYQQEREDR